MADGGPSRKHAGGKLDIEIVRHGAAWTKPALDTLIKQAARAGLQAAHMQTPNQYDVTILLTDDAEMQALNRTWRGKDAPTNVLSFPSGSEAGFLGDIVLAHETVTNEAEQAGMAFEHHVAHLVVHGVLHLLGFDHMQDAEAETMEDREREALAALGIADPYAAAEITS